MKPVVNRNAATGQKLTARFILSVFILATCGAANNFVSVAAKSKAVDVPQDSSRYSPENANGVEQHVLTVGSLRVHYIESGTGPAVVMIHGNEGGVEDYEFGVMQLLARKYRVVAIDRPGHGSSARPTGKVATAEYQAQLLHLTLLSLGIKQPVLVGHSWGGALALAYALNYPADLSGLVLLAPAAYPDKGGNALLRASTKIPVLADLSLLLGKTILGRRILRRVLARAFYPQSVPTNYYKLASSSWLRPKHLKAYLEDELALNASLKKLSRRYCEIKIPVVIVAGDEDKVVTPKENAFRLQTAIPQSRLIKLKDTGHEIPQTHPESVYAALTLISPVANARVQPAPEGR